HGGTAAGSTSLLIMFPESHLAVSVLINGSIMNFGDLWDVSFDIAQTFLKNQRSTDPKTSANPNPNPKPKLKL
ncbi:MAG: hypothetical protein MJK04_02685, partial [Psychrosphaera sp.]|nr:hypothetical protein [Psychrosphaera sp.]